MLGTLCFPFCLPEKYVQANGRRTESAAVWCMQPQGGGGAPLAVVREGQYAPWDEMTLLGYGNFCMSGAGASGRGWRDNVVEVSKLRVLQNERASPNLGGHVAPWRA